MACHTPPLKKETRGNAITQPQSHPIPKFYIFLMGWDRGWVMAFPLVSSLHLCCAYAWCTLQYFLCCSVAWGCAMLSRLL